MCSFTFMFTCVIWYGIQLSHLGFYWLEDSHVVNEVVIPNTLKSCIFDLIQIGCNQALFLTKWIQWHCSCWLTRGIRKTGHKEVRGGTFNFIHWTSWTSSSFNIRQIPFLDRRGFLWQTWHMGVVIGSWPVAAEAHYMRVERINCQPWTWYLVW